MKKTILGILIIVMSALMLAGCSLSYDGQDVKPEETTEQETTTEEENVNDKDGCLDDALFY